MTVKDNGMAGVMSPGVSRREVERGGQIIYNFAFAFVAPLRPHKDDRFRSGVLLHARSPPPPDRPFPSQSRNLSLTGGHTRQTMTHNPTPRSRPNASLGAYCPAPAGGSKNSRARGRCAC